MERKLELLKNIDIFSQLNTKEINSFAELCEFSDYNKNKIIFKTGDSSKHLYIVDSGEVRIVSRSKKEDEKVLATFIKGEIFGEFDLFENDLHTATAITNVDSKLLIFPGPHENFDIIIKRNSDILVKICHQLLIQNAGRIRQTNRLVSEKTSWIEELKDQMHRDKLTGFYNRNYLEEEFKSNMESIFGNISLLVIKPDTFKTINDTLGHEAGDIALRSISQTIHEFISDKEIPIRYRGNEFIIIYQGHSLEEILSKATKLHKILSDMDLGKKISNESIMMTYSMGISVYPEHADNLEGLIDQAFTRMFDKKNSGGNGILYSEDNVESYINFLKTVKTFSTLYLSEIRELSNHLKLLEIKKGNIICKEGDDGNELFIIKSGKANVTININGNSEKVIAEFSSGDFFGEMAIFENEKRSATCTAMEDSTILVLDKKDFMEIINNHPIVAIKIMMNMLDITSSRISNTSSFIAEMIKWGEEASKRAVTDELTGIYNRRYLDISMEKCFHTAKHENKSLSVIMADMDFFREVNEAYSHEVGDQYIVEVAKIFKENLRESDIPARYGGDEFTILLPDTDIKTAYDIAENIRKAVEKLDLLKNLEGPDFNLSISQGVASYPENCETLDSLKELSDKALYVAKEEGRNRVIISKNK